MENLTSEFKSKSGLRRIFRAFVNSADGFKTVWRTEFAFRQEILAFTIGTVVALSLQISSFQKLVLVGVMVLVLIVEIINSALEAVVDRISLERHPLSKDAKDLGSAAVALSIALAVVTWAVVIYTRYF
jgi:diacylglycerol kinase (ATP)